MNRNEILHYLKGGKFTAIYNPKVDDISDKHKQLSGRKAIIHQNCLNSPIFDDKYKGQYRFWIDLDNKRFWHPEEDFDDITIIDEFISRPGKTKKFFYKLVYLDETKLLPNFGKNNFKVPLEVFRDFDTERDDYILNHISNPKACRIEKCKLDLLSEEEPNWKIIYEEVKPVEI